MGTLNTSGDNLWAEQSPSENLDYSLDWSQLTGSGADPLASSVWTADTGVTLSNQTTNGSVTAFWVTGGQDDTWYRITNTVTTAAGRTGQRDIMLYVKQGSTSTLPLRSALFSNRFTAVANLRQDTLVVAASGAMPSVQVSDDYLWGKLLAAEAEISHTLRVPLAPTTFFPDTPTDAQIAALNGQPWAIDPGYDYSPGDFGYTDRWGMLKLRNKPVQSVSKVRFSYPGGATAEYDLPLDWLRIDRKYGTVQFVPSSTAFIAPLQSFVMAAMASGRTIPLAIQFTYVAGLANAKSDYPELLDAIIKTASMKIVGDAFLPQSGSISADGLSQSISNDMQKHHEAIDLILNGGKGGNGGLMTAIHGIRIGVM